MTLDFRFALNFVLTVFYIIFLKLVDSESYCFIWTLIEDLNFLLEISNYSKLI